MRRIVNIVLMCCVMAFAGCGGGNNGSVGLTGTVTVEGTQSASDFSSTVSFTISYSNPFVTSVGGVPVNYAVWVDGVLIDNVATNFNETGTNKSSFTVSYNIPKTAFQQSVRCQANSSNLTSSVSIKVEELDALDVTPPTLEFSETDLVNSTKEYTVSGGSGNYTVVSSDNDIVSVSPSGKTLVATRKIAGPGTVTITVTDTVTHEIVVVQATLVAIPEPEPVPEP